MNEVYYTRLVENSKLEHNPSLKVKRQTSKKITKQCDAHIYRVMNKIVRTTEKQIRLNVSKSKWSWLPRNGKISIPAETDSSKEFWEGMESLANGVTELEGALGMELELDQDCTFLMLKMMNYAMSLPQKSIIWEGKFDLVS